MSLSSVRRNAPLALLLIPPLGVAEDAALYAPADQRKLETVTVTATRREADVQDVSTAVSQADLHAVLESAPDVIAEALRGQPGVFFQQTTPGQGMPIIRGLKGSQVLHMVDGMRLNNAFFRSAPNQYLALVDAYAVQQVEVVRGAAGSLYGADAMGGVVQVLTREPVMESESWRANGRLYTAYGSADRGLVFRADGEASKEGAGLIGGVTWQDYSDRRTASGTVAPSAYRSEAADLKFLFDLGAASHLMFSAQVLEQPSTPRTDELVPGFGQTEPSSEQFSFQPNRRSFLHARYQYDGAADWVESLEVHLARQVITDDRLTQDFGSPDVNQEWNESTLDGLTASMVSSLAENLDLTWGLEVYRDQVRSTRQRSNLETGESQPVRARFPDDSTMDSEAVYASAVWQSTDRLDLSAGLRYSTFDIFLPSTDESASVRLSPDDFTGDLRLLYALNEQLNLVANLGRGFRPPNIFDLGTLGPRPGNRFNIANPELEPETVWSYDLGLKARSGNWEAEAFVFYLDYRNKITSVATGQITPDGRVVVRSENRNEVDLYGLEGSLRWLAGDNIDVYLALNWTRGEETGPGGVRFPADRVPPFNGRLGLSWQARPKLRLEPFLLFAARQDRLSPRDVQDPRIDPDGTDAWLTLNLNLVWQACDWLDLGLKLENLTDQAYREHGSGIDAPGVNFGAWANARF
jgi:outer membrane receptor protein involved in Fe transport